MNTKISYNSINAIRTKLLLFIDEEIRTNKTNNLKIISNVLPGLNSCIKFEETFSQNKTYEIYFSNSQNHQNVVNFPKSAKKHIENHLNIISKNSNISKSKINKNKKNEIFYNNFFPKTVTQKKNITYLKHSHDYKNQKFNSSSNAIISFKKKANPIKSKIISDSKKIYNKPAKSEIYLKKLCCNLKIMKKKQNRKKASVCFSTNSLKSKNKTTRFASSNSFLKHGKNDREEVSTFKYIAFNNRIKTKANKIKTIYKKLNKKDNSNSNNINTASRK